MNKILAILNTDAIALRLVDDFSRQLLVGACRVLADKDNPVRLHMFASVIRELFSYTLHVLAPDEQIAACSWFVKEKGAAKPTRRQRVIYAIQGGLSDKYVAEELYLDVEQMCTNVIVVIDKLSQLTHVRPKTLIVTPEEIESHGNATLLTLEQLLENITECRNAIGDAVEEKVYDAIYGALTSDTLPALHELASRYSIEEYYIDSVDITLIDSSSIHYKVKASVTVGLQWGSNSDIRNDMGAVGEEDFIVEVKLRAPVVDPSSIEHDEDGTVAVDTSSWWDGYYDQDDELIENKEHNLDHAF